MKACALNSFYTASTVHDLLGHPSYMLSYEQALQDKINRQETLNPNIFKDYWLIFNLKMLYMFNMFINNLVETIRGLGIGVDIGQEKVSILMYADDLVLLAENENDLQLLLNVLSNWCRRNHISVNETKSDVDHFRSQSVLKTNFVFSCQSNY